jgi:DNA-binding response OmpR family regulator
MGIASFIERGLRTAGYTTTVVGHGSAAGALARDELFDLVVLDLGLPDVDGVTVIEDVRRNGQNLPIIVLTAREGLRSTVASLDRGADDYMTKPFAFDELLARIRVRLKDPSGHETTVLKVGRVSLDLRTRRASVDGETIDLTAREYALAEVFLRSPDQVFSREQLLSQVWGYDFSPNSNVVDVYIRYLRKKFGQDFIETARGMGYRVSTEQLRAR